MPSSTRSLPRQPIDAVPTAALEPRVVPDDEAPPPAEEDFATLFAASEVAGVEKRRVTVGDVVRGRVIGLGPDSAFVAIGAKAEAVIDLAEFRDPETGAVTVTIGEPVGTIMLGR